MASHVVVIDSTFKRETVKTEPGTFIVDILRKACEKWGLEAEKYILKHNKKFVDLTQTLRQSGLSSGAKLELVQASKSAAPVSVALQLPESLANGIPSRRLTGTFSSATTFWMILRKFESEEGRNLNITGRGVAQTQGGMTGAGRIFYEQPVCQVMGRELSTIQDLQKSLASLGFNSGSCMIRLNFKVTGTPLEEAVGEITQYMKSIEEPLDSKAEATTVVPETAQKNADSTRKPAVSTVTELKGIARGSLSSTKESGTSAINTDCPVPDATETSQEVPTTIAQQSTSTTAPGTVLGPGNRKITVFSAPTDSTPRAALLKSDDSEFEPTLAHVKLHESRIKGESRNKRLPTAAEAQKLGEEKAAKKATIKSIEVKFRLPDGNSVSALFTNEDMAKDLYECVRGMLREEISGEGFTLIWMGDKGKKIIPKDGAEKVIVDLGFIGRTLVQFEWQGGVSDKVNKGTILKAEYLEKAQPIHVPDVPTVEEDAKEVGGTGRGIETSGVQNETNKGNRGIPKWFKGGKK